jgi:hypothetical protein
MNVRLAVMAAATAALLGSGSAQAQPAPVPLSQLNRTPWPHIGSPPPNGGQASRGGSWSRESAVFAQSLDSIKQSWTGAEPTSAGDLKFQVQQYEDLVRTVSEASGYGNVILADCLRRLSVTLIANYALAHPSDNTTIDDLLKASRPSLLDSTAVSTMLDEDLDLSAPEGSWHLSANRDQIDLVLHASGSSERNEFGRALLRGPSTNAALMTRRDTAALLVRLIETEVVRCVHLPGLVQFRRLGGRVEDLNPNDARPYMHLMEHDLYRFQFPPLGITVLGQEYIGELVARFGPNAKKPNAFTKRALE